MRRVQLMFEAGMVTLSLGAVLVGVLVVGSILEDRADAAWERQYLARVKAEQEARAAAARESERLRQRVLKGRY